MFKNSIQLQSYFHFHLYHLIQLNDFEGALYNIDEAILLASPYPELIDSGIYHANKALILLRKGLLSEAKLLCEHANTASKRSNDPDGKE